MKFKSLYLYNFMRYKGENRLEFSCDPEKPVTVVLGENASGKTTLSQAFRFALYGEIQVERGKREQDYCLLNHDVIEHMDANSKAHVQVQMEFVYRDEVYRITRRIQYRRRYPAKSLLEENAVHTLELVEEGIPIQLLSDQKEQIQAKIEEILPYYLSFYFLFDGEKWAEPGSNGFRSNVKESMHQFTGLSSLKNAMIHLKEMGSSSVIKQFESRITGGAMFDNIQKEKELEERRLQQRKQTLETVQTEEDNARRKCAEVELFLEQNRATEEVQKQFKALQSLERDRQKLVQSTYQQLVTRFSDMALYEVAQPLLERCMELMRHVHMDRKDVPHMRQATIDYLIQTGTCICGTPLHKDSVPYHTIMKYRDYLPPADIGSLLGEFERTARRWEQRAEQSYEDMAEIAEEVLNAYVEYEKSRGEREALESRMEDSIDFKEKRERYRQYQEAYRTFGIQAETLKGDIRQIEDRIARMEENMRQMEAKNQANRQNRLRAQIARELYEEIGHSYQKKETEVFQDLNRGIQENFRKIFKSQDKTVVLDEDYQIKMVYENEGREEKNLSEGEKIARNFAFIISVLEYSQRKKQESSSRDQETDDIETLPIVLDGPFSKLSNENISKVSGVLPQIAEQVILFMLEKDWVHTKLDAHVGAAYRIEKGTKSINAKLTRRDNGKNV